MWIIKTLISTEKEFRSLDSEEVGFLNFAAQRQIDAEHEHETELQSLMNEMQICLNFTSMFNVF